MMIEQTHRIQNIEKVFSNVIRKSIDEILSEKDSMKNSNFGIFQFGHDF